ncbi:YjbF family lipoprotein [Oceaniglobus indicus]|uniref:YjbF family lipoprotein n=1 Tax=Oceaniglobus indicus TaxID=2047749 RepID=UPI0011AB74B3|nr:YjbF family lipoprotein [Oceaniglobus indicus]
MKTGFGVGRKAGRRVAPLMMAAAALLAGCTGGSDSGGNDVTDLGRAAIGSIAASRAAKTGGVTATDAELRSFGRPLLVLTDLGTKSDAVIGIVSDRNGNVIWRSADGITLTLREGVVVATRGYGDDLMSAEVPDVRRDRGSVVRDHYYLGGNELIQRARYFCTLADAGQNRVVVTGVASSARLVVETCAGEDAAFENRYWIEADGTIRKSVQWINPERGAFQIETVPQGRRANVPAATPVAGVTISE